MKKSCAIIGSGIGGLASAIHLSKLGLNVTLFEKNSIAGGKISQILKEGFRFDTGPSLFTLPELVTELIDLEYLKIESSCKYFFASGKTINFYQDLNLLEKELERSSCKEYPSIIKRFNWAQKIYSLSANMFIFDSFTNLDKFKNPENAAILKNLHKMGFFSTMHSKNKREFKDPSIVQIFDRYATYNGSSPYKAPATLNMISHLEHNIGAFFPSKGIYSIAEELYNKVLESGVEFNFNTTVNRINLDKSNKLAVGIQYSNKEDPKQIERGFDVIINNCDIKHTIKNLLPPDIKYPFKKLLNLGKSSSSATIFYWGINREFPQLQLHNILFSDNYREEFDYIFDKKDIYQDPTIYIFISSKVVKSDAPQGCENWFVMINCPANYNQDWTQLVIKIREYLIIKIDTFLNLKEHSIANNIVFEQVETPQTIEERTLSYRGALYGNSSNSILSAFLRHPNRSPHIKNLFFTGGSVHPGGGIPLCLASAQIVNKEVIKYLNKV